MGLQHIGEDQRDSILSSAPHGSTAFPPGTWILDPNDTTLVISTRVLGVRPLKVTLGIREGVAEVSERGLMERLYLSFKAESATSGSTFRDRLLRGPSYLDASAFPLVNFNGNAVGEKLECVMTLKDRPGRLNCMATEASLMDDGRVLLTAHGSVDRRTIGLDAASLWCSSRHLNLALRATATGG